MMDTDISAQLTASTISVAIIQWLKRSPWFPFINPNSKVAPYALSAIFSIAAAAGIHFAFNHETGTLVITGLNAASATHGLFDAMESFCLNHILYKTMNPKPASGDQGGQ